MRSANAVTASVSAAQMERSMPGAAQRMRLESGKEEVLLRLDLSDLVLPKVNDLQVDGLRSNWFARLFGKH